MLRNIIVWFSNLLRRAGRWTGVVKAGLFLALFLPVFLMVYWNYQMDVKASEALVFSRREAISQLAATLLETKFDSIIDVGTSLVAQNDVRQKVNDKSWDEALADLESTLNSLEYIDSVVLFDIDGTLKAVAPPIPEVVGKNFGYRDYYLGVSNNWQPYVSEVFKRAAEPPYNVIVVAVPIRNTVVGQEAVSGILVLTIRLDTILNWAEDIDVGDDGFVYFVDQHGNAAGHPRYSDDEAVVNVASAQSVEKALRGESGVEIFYNPLDKEELITSYRPLNKYGWSAIVQQPTATAFELTTDSLQKSLIQDIIFGCLSAFLLYLLINVLFTIQTYLQKESIFLESVGDGLIGIDRSWNITLWNNAASVLTGWSKEEVLGKPFRDVIHFIYEDTREENIRFIEETMLFGKVHFMSNHTVLVQKNGQEISVADSCSPIFNERGIVDGAIIIFRDGSKDRELEKSRDEFTSLATHQLRTPISIINNYADLLADTTLTAEQKEELGEIAKASHSLAELANAMLNVSRIESGAINIAPAPLFIPDIADDIIKEQNPELMRKQLKLEKQYANDIPVINADDKLMTAIIGNLLSNAIKYTNPNGKVTLAISKTSTDVVITITDTGMGIPKEAQSKIFSKFFRAENVRNAEIPGTGLGLYTIKAILKQGGGSISFESKEGVGTSFHVAIPLSGMIKKEGMKGLT